MAQLPEQLREIPLRFRVDSSQICEMVDGLKELVEASREVVELRGGNELNLSVAINRLENALVKIDDADAPDPDQQTLDLNP